MKNKTNKHEKNKKVKQKEKIETKVIALFQALILVVAIIAFSWMIGNSIGVVSADNLGATSDSACTVLKGTCINTATTSCTGEIKIGLCPGDNTIRCCVPPAEIPPPAETKQISLTEAIAIGGAVDKYGPKISEKIKNVINKGTGKEVLAGQKLAPAPDVSVGNIPKNFWDYFTFGKAGPNHLSFLQSLTSNLFYATITATAIIILAKQLGASERNIASLTTVTYIGAGTGIAAVGIWNLLGPFMKAGSFLAGGPPGWLAAAVTSLFAGIHMLTGFQLYSQEVFTYRVGLWQPPIGDSECDKCNQLEIAGQKICSEYLCHSYGTACEFWNNETEYETCIEVGRGDVSPPVIEPAKEIYGENVFSNDKYDYKTSAAEAKIIYTGEGAGTQQCIPVFTPIKIAFTTNENAQCRIGLESIEGATNEETFSNMKILTEGTSYVLNHTLQLSSIVAASEASLENAGYELTNGGNYKFYIRCKDVRGNINREDYAMSFCVQKVDTAPPEIKATNPPENSYIPHGTTVIEDFQVYTDEPADCKWDFKQVNYQYMSYDFEWCSQTINEPLVGFDFGCRGNLTGFKDGVENKYYVACADQPGEEKRNVMRPYEIILKGTNKLRIQSVRINGRANGTNIVNSEVNTPVNIEVTTVEGAENGLARCLYSEDLTEPRTYSLFDNQGSKEYLDKNTLELYMTEGNYTHFIKCYDAAENTAETTINFSVEVDISPPTIVRVYKDEDALKIITNEKAVCVYSSTSCNYNIDDGKELENLDGKEHYTEWDTEKDLYIKCIDEFENYPDEGDCSISLRAFEIAQII